MQTAAWSPGCVAKENLKIEIKEIKENLKIEKIEIKEVKSEKFEILEKSPAEHLKITDGIGGWLGQQVINPVLGEQLGGQPGAPEAGGGITDPMAIIGLIAQRVDELEQRITGLGQPFIQPQERPEVGGAALTDGEEMEPPA